VCHIIGAERRAACVYGNSFAESVANLNSHNTIKINTMKATRSILAYLANAALLLMISPIQSFSEPAHRKAVSGEDDKPTIILVHGAFADGSSWNKVIPILQKQGYKTIAVQNPLTSLNDDVAFVDRAIAEVTGSIVLVGHSWGGAVITQAGNNDRVKALVYVAAYAPDEGESLESISKDAYETRKIPNVPGFADPVIADGFIRLKEETIVKHFAQDLPQQDAMVLAAGQGRFHVSTLGAKISNPAWKNKPSFYIVSDNDHVISPQLETEMAAKIHATVFHLPASHVAMLSKPEKVAEVILEAAAGK
jgi:pimeloyl-ACP methyl ester carboxylesterase